MKTWANMSLSERIAARYRASLHLADLHPPLGVPGGPCHVIDRIDHTIRNLRLRKTLTDEVNRGEDLSNTDASKVYPVLHEHGVDPIRQVVITSHGQYRMDLRGITVDDVRTCIGSFLHQMGEWKSKGNVSYDRMLTSLDRGEKLEWVDRKTGLKIILQPSHGGSVTLISAFWKGGSDPFPPHGSCVVPKH